MSIFKSTISKYVQNQLIARQRIISQYGDTGLKDKNNKSIFSSGVAPRDNQFLRYVSGKNSWTRMTSFVNVDKKIGAKTYKGDELARKYVLEGGTQFYNSTTNKFQLRSGIGKQSGVYGGNVDEGGNKPLGYRPMPGITSVQVTNKSAYGSLREATVKFYCWDKHQLEELELLYMRTGYTILLEWGWSQYLESSNATTLGTVPIVIRNFDIYPTIDAFETTLYSNDDTVYNAIEKLKDKTHGNYDAMLGYVKNFSWSLMQNGGFECSTVLISRGEVISSVKISSNSNLLTPTPGVKTMAMSQFEQIFYNYQALLNETELSTTGQFGSTTNTQISQITQTTVDQFVTDTKNVVNKYSSILCDDGTFFNLLDGFDNTGTNNYYGGVKLINYAQNPEQFGTGIEYVRFDVIIALINYYFNLKDENNNVISKILIPNGNLCLACPDSVSIDPTVCIIRNAKATNLYPHPPGPAFCEALSKGPFRVDGNSVFTGGSYDLEEFLDPTNSYRGRIKYIYVALNKVIEIFKSKMGGDSSVSVIDFLKELLNQISRSLGGINNFQLHTTNSTIEIIDVKYLEQGAKKSKYVFDLMGLKSICRDVRITSRIFESQSTMIGIAAQSTSNVGDLYSSTQTTLNAGLTDRLIKKKLQGDETKPLDLNQIKLNLYYYLFQKVDRTPFSIDVPNPDEVSSALSYYKTYLYQTYKTGLGNTAIIPFELEITLDGISGLVIGQVFKIDTSILPQAYTDANVGFITTGVSHTLDKNDWVTIIKAQICVLD